MNTHTNQTAVAGVKMLQGPFVEAAAQRLYDCECALHAARSTGVDEWIAAAADRLHKAVEAYLRVAVC